ncbi:MAG: DUF1045 domain-containing protein [Paracoccaceae bacterium]
MEKMKRYAIYYAPKAGEFADSAATWLGWDMQTGNVVPQPTVTLPRPLAEITSEPRKYGFHGTIKAPFRLAEGVRYADFSQATARLAASLRPVVLPGLQMINLEGFLALVPQGDTAALMALAAEVVRSLDPYRAPLTKAEIARRRPDRLTARQRELLAAYGYPYVMEEFRFHLTLTGPLTEAEHPDVAKVAATHFARLVPTPFRVEDLCLVGEDEAGRFHLLHRYALSA